MKNKTVENYLKHVSERSSSLFLFDKTTSFLTGTQTKPFPWQCYFYIHFFHHVEYEYFHMNDNIHIISQAL